MNPPSTTPSSIPHIDLSPFQPTGSLSDRRAAASKLYAAAAEHGYVALTGHGVPQERVDEAFGFARRLYAKPEAVKMQARRPDEPTHHRGYSAPGRERAAGIAGLGEGEKARMQGVSDFKETYEIGSEANEEKPNIWLPDEELPGFKDFMMRFHGDLHGASMRVLDALTMSLELPPAEHSALKALHPGVYSQLRLAHYLPVSEALAKDQDTFRLAAHRDFSSYTILFQDGEHAGLEFQNPTTGEWVLAPPTAGVLYMNIADLFHRLSNGRFPSANHRVIAPLGPSGRVATSSRYSLILFVSPKGSETIEPLESLVMADGKREYEPITVGDYHRQMFAATQKTEE